jgi:hypothetical protein
MTGSGSLRQVFPRFSRGFRSFKSLARPAARLFAGKYSIFSEFSNAKNSLKSCGSGISIGHSP